jgi:hypothetical protein
MRGLKSVPEVVFIDKLADLRSVEVGGGAEGAGPLGSSLRFLRRDSQKEILNAGLTSVPEVVFMDKLIDLRSVEEVGGGGGTEGAGPLGSSLRFLRWDS